jgi:enamine deaminase RidA (YjgF/YER057c/UK114 family)
MLKRYDGDGRMSKAVIHNDTIYLRGLTIADKTMDVTQQTQAVLSMVEELLNKHGSDKNHILSAIIHLKEIGLFDQMNLVWDKWVEKGHEPARTCVEAIMSHEDILVEITIIAALK